jgi:6-phosphogluconolactonase
MSGNNNDSDRHKGVEYTRRDFLTRSAAVAGAGLAAGSVAAMPSVVRDQTQSVRDYFGYVSFQRDNRISIFTMDPGTGKLTWQQQVAVPGGPGPMAIDPGKNFLYVGSRDSQKLSSYRIDHNTGGLSLLGTVPLQGEPVQMSTDRTGRFLLSAYLYQSTAAVHAVAGDGIITFPPIEWRYTAYGAHGIHIDRSNRFVFVPHLARSGGPNAIAQFTFDQNTGRLTPNTPSFLSLQEYLGPRHLCFHPTLDVVYSSDEQGSSATAYRLDPSAGTLTNFQTISTVPSDYEAASNTTCSQIQISPSGKFLFVPTRGHDSVASFAIDASSGGLTATGRMPTEPGPRAFSLDPEGRFLVVAGGGRTNFGRLVSYQVNQDSGELIPVETYEGGNGPTWVLITQLAG